jgi:hypothetical protein
MYQNENNNLLMRRKIFLSILYFSSKKNEDGKEYSFPFESYYVWDAMIHALADHIGFKLSHYPVQFAFEGKIWDEIKVFFAAKATKSLIKKDDFLNIMFNLLKVEWEDDEMGEGEYRGEIKDFYSQMIKRMISIVSLSFEFLNNNNGLLLFDFNDQTFDDQTIEKCKILGKLTRFYLNKHLVV